MHTTQLQASERRVTRSRAYCTIAECDVGQQILSTLSRSKRTMPPLVFSNPISNELAKNDLKIPRESLTKAKL